MNHDLSALDFINCVHQNTPNVFCEIHKCDYATYKNSLNDVMMWYVAFLSLRVNTYLLPRCYFKLVNSWYNKNYLINQKFFEPTILRNRNHRTLKIPQDLCSNLHEINSATFWKCQRKTSCLKQKAWKSDL